MNEKQLEVMKLKIHPSFKLAMIAMLEWPDANREALSRKMNVDKTQLSTTAKRLVEAGLIDAKRAEDSVSMRYTVKI